MLPTFARLDYPAAAMRFRVASCKHDTNCSTAGVGSKSRREMMLKKQYLVRKRWRGYSARLFAASCGVNSMER